MLEANIILGTAGSSVATVTGTEDLLDTALSSLHSSGSFKHGLFRFHVPNLLAEKHPPRTGFSFSGPNANRAQQGANAELLTVISGELLTSSWDIVR